MKRGWKRRIALVAGMSFAGLSGGAVSGTHAAGPNVLLVGTFNGVSGAFTSIQAAVDAAQAGDWILVGPGDYRERQDYTNGSHAAGVAITTPNLHLRGMDRNSVIVDGTKAAAPTCSSAAADQDYGPANQGRNGIEVFGQTGGADGVSIDNLTVCNFLTSAGGGNGNQIWWNGGDGGGSINMHGYEGSYLTATSTYANSSPTNTIGGACCGVNYPAGSYGIFSSDATRASNGTFASWTQDYASNMADSSFYIGACQQRCDVIMDQDHGQNSALCVSTTNAGGYLLIEHTTCDLNKTGPVSNSQNNDDRPSPQRGLCDSSDPSEPQVGATGTASCTVWEHNTFNNNNNPNVPGNGTSGLAGGGPVGTGLILAGTRDITLYQNDIENNNSWGALIVDLPDAESGPSNCQGGLLVSPPGQTVCFYPALGNVSIGNTFRNNGTGYSAPAPNGNATLGDIGLATVLHTSPPFDTAQGNCFSGDTDPGKPLNMPTTDPPGIETLPAYAPANGLCPQSNAGDYGPLAAEAECAGELLAPCPTLETLCNFTPLLPCVPVPLPIDYPRPQIPFTLSMPPAQTTMPDPCAGVPANGFCATLAAVTPEFPVAAAAPVAAATVALAVGVGGWMRRRRARRAVD